MSKYFYKDHFIRTSKRIYNYAVVIENEKSFKPFRVIACTEKLGNAYREAKKVKAYWENAKNNLPKYEHLLSLDRYHSYMEEYDNNINGIKIVRIEAR